MRRKVYVAVIGPGEASDAEIALAERVGALLAQSGAILVSGGLGGVMRASCKGATDHGGLTLGLLPGIDRAEGNEFLTMSVPTGLGQLRNGLVVRAADAVIAIGGAWGTLSEIALTMRAGTPLVAIDSWQVRPPDVTAQLFPTVDDPADAVRLVLAQLANR